MLLLYSISGTLPKRMSQLRSLEAVLLNNLRLSGTIPRLSDRRQSDAAKLPFYAQLETLSFCRVRCRQHIVYTAQQ